MGGVNVSRAALGASRVVEVREWRGRPSGYGLLLRTILSCSTWVVAVHGPLNTGCSSNNNLPASLVVSCPASISRHVSGLLMLERGRCP